jgi:5-aminopentanamidase
MIPSPVVAVCQVPLVVGDPDGNLRRTTDAITAVADDADVVVLPELANSGYVFRDPEEARALAEPVSGPTVQAWLRLASRHDLVIVGGLCELDDEAQVRNSAVMLDRDGVLAVYRKAHLWDAEPDSFLAGTDPPPVVETRAGRLSMMICYDADFPEWVRLAGLAGADVLCLPTNWPVCGEPPGPYPGEVLRILAQASMNLMYIAVAARVGTERGVTWVAGSGIASPAGALLTPLTEGPATLVARLDLSSARDKATSLRNDQFGDRRPELYGRLTSRDRSHTGAARADATA